MRSLLVCFLLIVVATSSSSGQPPVDRGLIAQLETMPSPLHPVQLETESRNYDLAPGPAESPSTWSATNLAHGFRIEFGRDGVRVAPVHGMPPWEWSTTIAGYGRGGPAEAIRLVSLSSDRNRIDYDRGLIVEWYVNDGRGLEQGFTLLAPPVGEGDSVEILLRTAGNLSVVDDRDGRIDFGTADGRRVLRYASLVVRDADGRELPARMEAIAESGLRGIRLSFDDRDAVYPVTVDPLLTSPFLTAWFEQEGAAFGYSVAAGDVNFDGHDDLLVGAPLHDVPETDGGSVWLYLGSESGLTYAAGWVLHEEGAKFGSAVAVVGDVDFDHHDDVLVGAPFEDAPEVDGGGIHIFHGVEGGLAYQGPLYLHSADAHFGAAVAAAGDVNDDIYDDAIVGAPGADWVLVLYGSADGLVPTWEASSDQAGSEFARSVSSAWDVNQDGYHDVIVGAPRYDDGEQDEGAAFVWYGGEGGLGPTGVPSNADWWAKGGQADALFGRSVASFWNGVVIGAPLYDNGQEDEGVAFAWYGGEGGLGPAGLPANAHWTAESNQAGAELGRCVANAGDVNGDFYTDVIVGAPLYDNGETDEGAAFVWYGLDERLGSNGSPANADWMQEGGQEGAEYGHVVAGAGDVNNDDIGEAVVGAPFYDLVETDAGLVLAYQGTSRLAAVDWVQGSGDELLTRDPLTGLDWLEITSTADLSVDDVRGGAGGWVTAGFRHALNSEVSSLYRAAGVRYQDGLPTCANARGGFLLFNLMGTTTSFVCNGNEICRAHRGFGIDDYNTNLAVASEVESYRPASPCVYSYLANPMNGTAPPSYSLPDYGNYLVRGLTQTDLRVNEVYFLDQPGSGNTVDDPLPGQEVYPHFRYWVNTPGDVTGTIWRIEVDGEPLCAQTGSKSSGAWKGWCTSPWTVTAGAHSLHGVLDPEGAIAEDSEDNNDAYRNYLDCTTVVEVCDGVDNDCDGLIDELSDQSGFYNANFRDELCWEAMEGADRYETVRSSAPDFPGGCTVQTTLSPCWYDPGRPDPNEVYYYLTRVLLPFAGSWGRDSSGAERVDICP